MGEFRPYESFGADFIEEFFRNTQFPCLSCGKECRLIEGKIIADEGRTYAIGNCSLCTKPQKFDVTHVWREE